jgi:hypothetical protein
VLHHRQRTVVVAVVAVGMMETAVHEIVDVIAMRHGFVAAIRPVPMRRLVAGGVMFRVAAVRIEIAHSDHMSLDTAALGMLQETVIEIVDVAFVSNAEMTASGAMNVRRSLALFGCHGGSCVAHPQSSLKIIPKRATEKKRTSRRSRRHAGASLQGPLLGHQPPRRSLRRAAAIPLLTDTTAGARRGRNGPCAAPRKSADVFAVTTVKRTTDLPAGA